MGKKQTADGRWIIGGGENRTDYKGFLHWRECYICLTEDGATEESVNYLNALKDYALAHYALGEPIMPPSMTVWVVANGKATAVQADDVKVEDGDYTICGITYSDGAWDYSNAGQGQGGGSSLPAVTSEDNGDVLTVVDGAWAKAAPSGGGDVLSPVAEISINTQETDVMTFTDGTTRYLVPEWYYPTAGDDDTIVNTKYYVNGSEVLFKQTSDSQVESTDNAYTIIVDTDIETSNSYFVVTAPQYPVTLKIEGAAIYWVSAFNVPLAICRAASAGETLLELFVGDTTGRECFTVSVSHESIGWLIADTQITDEEKQLPNILGEYYIDGMADDYGYTFYVDFSVVQDAIQIAISTKLSAPMNNTTLGEYLLTLDDSFIGLPLTL